jgi:cephalosporin hydroxylase
MCENYKKNFHKWYYEEEVWKKTSFLGVPCQKCIFDLWNYQEIILEYSIGLVIEFGVLHGGATRFFSTILSSLSDRYRVVGFDIAFDVLSPEISELDNVELHQLDTSFAKVTKILSEIRKQHEFPALFLLDSNHHRDHVVAELQNILPLLRRSDYVIVEDTNLNGYPVVPEFGPGPMEGLEYFREMHPDIFTEDTERVEKFGFSFAPRGYLLPVGAELGDA